jgi:hypothetical protein
VAISDVPRRNTLHPPVSRSPCITQLQVQKRPSTSKRASRSRALSRRPTCYPRRAPERSNCHRRTCSAPDGLPPRAVEAPHGPTRLALVDLLCGPGTCLATWPVASSRNSRRMAAQRGLTSNTGDRGGTYHRSVPPRLRGVTSLPARATERE